MGTAAFDKAWGDPPAKPQGDALDAMWDSPHAPNIHEQFKSGALQKRMARENANDTEMAAAQDEEAQPGVMASIADAAQGIPGVAMAQAAVRAGARTGLSAISPRISAPESYTDAYNNIKRSTDKVPASAKIIGRMATGSVPAVMMGPLGGTASGAAIGGLNGLLDADPNVSAGGRAWNTATNAAVGAALGKTFEVGSTALRAIRAPTSGANLITREAARDASANTNYAKAIAEGQGRTNTGPIRAVLNEPDNAEIQAGLHELRQNRDLAPDSPEMLDKIYKAHSDRAKGLKSGLEAVTVRKPNMGRESLTDTGMAQSDLLDAMSGPEHPPIRATVVGSSPLLTAVAGAPASQPIPPMPTYRTAVQDYAKASGDIAGVRKGQDILRSQLNRGVTSGRNLDRTTPEEFARWAHDPSTPSSETAAASEGVLGASKQDLYNHPFSNILGGAMSKAPGLLRSAGSSTQTLTDVLTRMGLIGANAAAQ